MKKILIAGLFVLTMLSTVSTALAANTVTVTSITVLEEQEGSVVPVATYTPDADNISLDYSQMLEVTLKVADGRNNVVSNAQTSFLSYSSEVYTTDAELEDLTIQHVALKSTASNGTATVRFRPRTSVGLGSFIAKIGATDAETAATFNYTVTEIPKSMTITALNNSMPANSQQDATFKIVTEEFADTDYSGFSVFVGDSDVSLSENYTIADVDGELILTINNAVFANSDNLLGEEVAVRVRHDGYKNASGKIVITPAVYGVEFELDGGTINGETPASYTYGTGLTLPTGVTKENYHFTGWYDNTECTGNVITSISATESGAKKYYAGWSNEAPSEYMITFVDHDGTVLQRGNVAVGTVPTCTEPTRAEDDMYTYEFAGWQPDVVEVKGVAEYTATYTMTAKTYKVTLDYDGGQLSDGDTDITRYTCGIGATLPTPVRAGFVFDGWYADEDFTGEAVKSIWTDEYGDKTYYAKWSQIEEKITIDVYDDFKDKVTVEKLVKGSTTRLIITAKDTYEISELVMYNAVYTNGVLKSVSKIPYLLEDGVATFKFSTPQTDDSESYKLMLWEKTQKPVIEAIEE